MKIIQVVMTLDAGDGIGNDILGKDSILRGLGYDTLIGAYAIHPALHDRAIPFDQIEVKPDDILIHHYSGHCALVSKVRRQKCIKVMLYHNITPPEFVDGTTREFCIRGFEQLKTLRNAYDFYLGDSQFNVNCLRELSVTDQAGVLPIMVEFPHTAKRRQRNEQKETAFLFVGRCVQNKKIEDIISVFNEYYCSINANSRLLLPGNLNISDRYAQKIRAQIADLPSRHKINLLGKVSDERLRSLYGKADLFLSMSEHEGFGIPLLEAMNYGLPVIAYNSTAVGDTLGDSGVLVNTKDPKVVARIAATVLEHPNLAESIVKSQNKNLQRFSRYAVARQICEYIEKWTGKAADKNAEEYIAKLEKEYHAASEEATPGSPNAEATDNDVGSINVAGIMEDIKLEIALKECGR